MNELLNDGFTSNTDYFNYISKVEIGEFELSDNCPKIPKDYISNRGYPLSEDTMFFIAYASKHTHIEIECLEGTNAAYVVFNQNPPKEEPINLRTITQYKIPYSGNICVFYFKRINEIGTRKLKFRLLME